METVIDFLKSLWKDISIGEAPEPIFDHIVDGSINRSLKWKITFRVNRIRNAYPGSNFKFGKSGHPPTRADFNDYRGKPYTKMYVLYESESEKNVSGMEVHYIQKYQHLENNDNKRVTDKDQMTSYDGKYYMYMVV